jgi:hypothetical protein
MGNTHPKSLTLRLIPNRSAADALLREAEANDRYLEECYDDRTNLLARKGMTYHANSISAQDHAHYQSILDQALSMIPQRLHMDLQEVLIVPLMPSADGGMPHTRPSNLICCPSLTQLSSTTTLIHELWHIHQRKYQSAWLSIFQKLGWRPWNGILPPALERYCRFNPDTIDSPLWIYQNKWIPLPIFKDITHPSMKDTEIWFYQPYEKYHIKNIPSELKAQFPTLPLSAYEHPRELTAYALSEPDAHRGTPGFRILLGAVGQLSIQIK